MARLINLFASLVLIAVFFGVLLGSWAFVLTPPADDIQARVNAYAKANHVAVLGPDQVPQQLADAIVATEDERFYSHHGLDTLGILRALLDDVRYHCGCQGGSTITQQLAKIIYLDGSDYGFNKIDGMALALKIEHHSDKGHILADYLSVTPTGPTVVGMSAAACSDFGRPLDKLDLAGYALLAGLPQAPSNYDPLQFPLAALTRRNDVLARMRSEGYITPEQDAAAMSETYQRPAHRSC